MNAAERNAHNRLVAARARHDGAAQNARAAVERITAKTSTREHEIAATVPEVVTLIVFLLQHGEPEGLV